MTPSRKPDPKPAISLNRQQIMSWRVHRHHLHRRAPREAMVEVVAELGGRGLKLSWADRQ